jgi:glycosyltransferase involved in cell wall biosynthesis
MDAPVVGYVIRMFPQLSETFIANEILGLERLGLALRIYSYRTPKAAVTHECVRRIQAPVTYLPDPLTRRPWRLLSETPGVYRLDPHSYRHTVRHVLADTLRERNLDAWRRLFQAVYLASQLADSGVRHLHAHMARGATHVTMLASMLTGLPFSFTGHARDIYYRADQHLLRARIEAAEFVVTCTRANQEYLRQLVGTEQRHKIHLAYHGVDTAKFSPAREEVAPRVPTILSAGRLVEKKGFPYLVRACAALRDKGYPFRCVVVGEGPERGRLEEMIRILHLGDAVSLPGECSQEELLTYYQRATVFALPCCVLRDGDRDGIPNVLLEAMAVGLPVVSSSVSGIPELMQNGDNGLLVPERNDRALASALELLIQDDALRDRLGQRGRLAVARDFDPTTSARRLAELFREGCSIAASQPEMSLIEGR